MVEEVSNVLVEERSLRFGGQKPLVYRARNRAISIDRAGAKLDLELLSSWVVADRREA